MKKFSNKITKLAAIIAVTAAMFGSVLSVDAATVKTTDSVKLREGTSTDTKHLDTIGKGVELKSDDSKEVDGYTWYKVNYNGKDGYIRGDFAEVIESEEEEEEPAELVEPGTRANIGGDNVNVRSEASEDGEIVATAESGQSYDVVGETTDDNGNTWYKVIVDGEEGYVNANDVSISSGEEESAEPVNTDSTEIANVISSRIIPGDVDLKGMTIDETTLNEWASGNYYVLYTTDSKGGDNWYLYSLSDKQFEQISDLHASPDTEKKEKKGGVSIIVVIVLVIIIIALAAALVFTNLKKGNGIGGRKNRGYDSYDDEDDEDEYDDDYEDDEDEYDDDEYDDEEEYEPAPKKRGLFGGKKDKKSKKYDDEDDYYDDDDYEDDEYDDDEYEDDDYEFDFLNMDK